MRDLGQYNGMSYHYELSSPWFQSSCYQYALLYPSLLSGLTDEGSSEKPHRRRNNSQEMEEDIIKETAAIMSK